jgi:hypothetical protein
LGETLGLENVARGDPVFSPGAESRLQSPGPAAIRLIDDLTDKAGKDCPVAAELTDAERAELLQIKQGIEKAESPDSRHRERNRSDPGEHRALFCPPDCFVAALVALTKTVASARSDPGIGRMGEAPLARADKNRPLHHAFSVS